MEPPKKPSGKTLAPTVDMWQAALEEANREKEDKIPEDAYTVRELCKKYSKTRASIYDFLKPGLKDGRIRLFRLKRLDHSGRPRISNFYQMVKK